MLIKFNADQVLIERRKPLTVNDSNRKESKKQIDHEYKNSDKVFLEKPGILYKVSAPYSGPYEVPRVFMNDIINIKKGAVTKG